MALRTIMTLALACTILAARPVVAQDDQNHDQSHEHRGEHHPQIEHESPHGHAGHRFDDAQKWAGVFEDPERDSWQRPGHVLRFLDLQPGDIVVDIGSATGYFPVRFAPVVSRGTVYGIDIEQTLVDYLNERAAREGYANIVSHIGELSDPLIREPADVVFLCNTYHHISSREDYFHKLIEKLQEDGTVVIVDFFRRELPVGPPVAHKMSWDEVVAEMAGAGYESARIDTVSLPYQYMLEFTPGD